MEASKSTISARLGFWSAILLTCVLVAYTTGIMLLLFSKPGQWQNIHIYAQQINSNWHLSLTFCHVMIFLAAPLYLILIGCLDDLTEDKLKICTKTSLNFAIVLTVLGSINYFIQFSMVKLSIEKGHLEGLEQFIELNPYSAIYAIVTLGWTFFFGLSSLFVSPVFRGSLLDTTLKYSFIGNGIFCLVGFFGYIIDMSILYIIYFIGMGISMLVFSFSLILHFRRIVNKL